MTTSIELRRKLRSVTRMRREVLQRRAQEVEDVLTHVLMQANRAMRQISVASTSSGSEARRDLPAASDSCDDEQRLFARVRQQLSRDFSDSENNDESILGSTRGVRDAFQNAADQCSESNGAFSQQSPDGLTRQPYSTDVPKLQTQLDFLNDELQRNIAAVEKAKLDESQLIEQVEQLRTQLLESRHETIELRIQNSELLDASTPQISDSLQRSCSLSWEETKKQLLRQFEKEAEDSELSVQSRKEVQKLLEASGREIADRDQQICELKAILNMQTGFAREGELVGAKAIEKLLETEPIIAEERNRLAALQSELEQKLRQAEIEVSMERARMARERIELQALRESIASKAIDDDAATSPIELEVFTSKKSPRQRKWLERLGIRED